MVDYITRLFSERGLPPHGFCLLWDPALIWTHVASDALTGLAYFSIPVVLWRFLAQRRDIEFGWVIWLFAAFIMACGFTHFMSILVLWVPAYGVEGLVKLFTAAVSVLTAIALWPLLPKVVALPSPRQLQDANASLLASIAERDEALARLRQETAERERAEALLRQTQRMDAIGHLTGGVAHDFNNLLMIVTGNIARAQRLGSGEHKLQVALGDALEGATKAADLTRRLLAFARQQPLQPKRQDLNDLLRSLSGLLERTLGDGYVCKWDYGQDLPPVVVDAAQTENALLNLVLNARDAMPDGGTLFFQTFRRGALAVVEVRDTGCGMSEETRSRACEPFFTTKAVGHGSGLGLSQVYGFMKQSGGDMSIECGPGGGTTVRLSFPGA